MVNESGGQLSVAWLTGPGLIFFHLRNAAALQALAELSVSVAVQIHVPAAFGARLEIEPISMFHDDLADFPNVPFGEGKESVGDYIGFQLLWNYDDVRWLVGLYALVQLPDVPPLGLPVLFLTGI